MVMSKKCFKCGTTQPLTEFYQHKGMADGHLGKCKPCTKSDSIAHREKNAERYRAYDRDRAKNPNRIALASEINKRWRAEDTRRQKCHNAVARAVRKGDLLQEPCSRCGDANSVAHHESYDRPLDVVWLCQVHHKQRHKELAIEGIEP
jgi:hypothetical protein